MSRLLSLAIPGYSPAEHGLLNLPHRVSITILADRAHASLVKAAALVGLGRRSIIQLGSSMKEIEDQLHEYSNGRDRGVIVSLSFGEVNTV